MIALSNVVNSVASILGVIGILFLALVLVWLNR